MWTSRESTPGTHAEVRCLVRWNSHLLPHLALPAFVLGFVHNAVIDHHLKDHEAPEDIEFYFCGPPLMNQAVLKMCDDWGVPPENVAFDDFGG